MCGLRKRAKRWLRLDDQERKLEPHMLVITDGQQADRACGRNGRSELRR